MKTILLTALLMSLAIGCATAYKKNGFMGGYSETKLDENIWVVSFRGNGYTKAERATDFALLRCAELALQNDYEYFTVVEANSDIEQSSYTTPTRETTTGSAYTVGGYTYGSSTTTTTGGQTYIIAKPSASNTIVCFKEKPEETFTYNAKFVFESIKDKYNLKISLPDAND